ncbi:MAG: beta-galactosidase [Paludibacter sp.]|nr:beta-galactosidase [Paludibacter sp.]
MKSIYCMILILIISAYDIKSQEFFPKEKLMETGVYYYPENWSPTQWNRDLANIAARGYEFTHFAEFSWAMLEPTEGKYDFKWLDAALELAHKHGLKVIMCTPSPTPPAWLTQKYPEVLLVKDNGVKASHGTRQQCSWSSPKYRQLVSKIVLEMAKHYGNDRRIWGWQIDNEPSHYGVIDYGPSVEKNFRVWLKNKYGSIDKLNKTWGGTFWSGMYNNFNQIELPNPLRLISSPASPHSILDFKRFSADECASFVSMQNVILKKYVDKSQFVTTNFMYEHDPVDPWRNKDLDFISYTAYPVSGFSTGSGTNGFRMGDWWKISWANDYFRSCNGITGVMELQPGQVNWGNSTSLLLPGTPTAYLWNAFVGNLKFACAYRFRQPLNGAEQYYTGMVGPDGVTDTPGGLEWIQFIKDMKKVRELYEPDAKNPSDYELRRVGFMFSLDNLWDQQIQAQNIKWSYLQHQYKLYANLKSLNCPVDFLDSVSDFSKYKVIVAPSYQLVSDKLCQEWEKYVLDGGHLVLTVRSGQKDVNGNLYEAKWAAKISKLIGGSVDKYDNLPENIFGTVELQNEKFKWNNWADIISPMPETEVWASYSDQFYKGKAAVTNHKLGKGTVTFIGVSTENGIMERNVMKLLFQKNEIPFVELPQGMVVDYRDGFGVAINYSSESAKIPSTTIKKLIIGSENLEPAGIAVWKY